MIEHGDERGLVVAVYKAADDEADAERRNQRYCHDCNAEAAADHRQTEHAEQEAQIDRREGEQVPAEKAEFKDEKCAEAAAEYGGGITGCIPDAVLLVVMQHDPAGAVGHQLDVDQEADQPVNYIECDQSAGHAVCASGHEAHRGNRNSADRKQNGRRNGPHQTAQEQAERHADACPERCARGDRLKDCARTRTAAAGEVGVEPHKAEGERTGNDEQQQYSGKETAACAAQHRLRNGALIRPCHQQRKRRAEHGQVNDQHQQDDRQRIQHICADAGAEMRRDMRFAFTLAFFSLLGIPFFHFSLPFGQLPVPTHTISSRLE